MPITTKLKPARFYRNERCTKACSLNPDALPGEMGDLVHSWFEAGDNNPTIAAKSDALGHHISDGAAGRHRKNHLEPMGDESRDPTDMTLVKINHIEFLEQLVARSAQSVHFSSKVSPEMGIRAIEMIYKLTQGSQMDNFMTAVSKAMAGAAEDDESEYMTAIEAAEAHMSADEAAQSEAVSE